MKVFFTTTPRLKQEDPTVIDKVYSALTELGYVLTSDYLKTVDVNEFYTLNNKKVPVYYEEIFESLKKADVVVFEASLHSIGVGMLVKEAMDLNKGVIILHKKNSYPFLLSGVQNDRVVISEYTNNNLKEVLSSAFEYLAGAVDVRFNFFISPEIGRFLDWISKKKRLPRAVYLRKLIEEDMHGNKEYNEGSDE